MKSTAVIYLRFKEKVSEEKAQEIIDKIWNNNDEEIEGMEYNQFKDEKTLVEVYRLVKNFCKAN